MQTITRTLSTTDSHDLKIKMIKQNAESQIQTMMHEIAAIEAENKKLSALLLGKGGLTAIVKKLLFVVLAIAVIISIAMYQDDSLIMATKNLSYGITAIILFIYIVARVKYRKIMNERYEMEEKINKNQSKLKTLRYKIDQIEEQKNRDISNEKSIYDAHMENEINLLKQEMTNAPTDNADMMECPRCAEPIKKKAKICRYCKIEL
jgi:Skp family chaperone for outer membrane proteins